MAKLGLNQINTTSSGNYIYITGKGSSGLNYLDISGVNSEIEKELNQHEVRIGALEVSDADHEVRIQALENTQSSDKNYVHDQEEPSDTWTIVHNLGKFPSVEIVDSAGTRMFPEIQQISENVCVAKFSTAMKGKAYLN